MSSLVAEPEPKREAQQPALQPFELLQKRRSFVCKFDDCGKKFLDQLLLKEHMSSHGEKQVG